ncbi:ABC transporter ATP-binding protein [Flavobacteriales bacterium]|nr:ABC transporter ATP-binding protein [Flavobacteriales bacterium]MDG1145802.1 ABC transporter ATP-binding protein [Flavobacteriales bacterium]MDG1396067.1 ABC transporter ATP-binding protein [Flavobacteriales bacterium]|tara:strand:- start:443 stop:1126 length:684 start_codon:yes stop_codon:yes gene_type:complete
MEIIKTNQLTKIYSDNGLKVVAVNNVDISIKQGEFTAIVGPSGSGKTTLLNMIGGLDNITQGSVEISGTNISSLSENELIDFRLQNIGFVFQAYNLIPVLTAKENVAFIMLLQGVSEKERQLRSEALLKEVGLEDKLDVRPNQLSGGQQQRVAVARALASKPSFILADEPTANLDSSSTTNLLNIMAEMNEKENVTFLFSTHDQRVIDRAKRIITIEDGKIISDERA